MRYLGIIPARGGSKGIPLKNIRMLCGKPLIEYTIEAALESGKLDRLYVSTDHDDIAKISETCGARVIMRPSVLAEDTTPTLPVLQSVVKKLEQDENYFADAVMTLQPTSPLRESSNIIEAVELFESDPHADSLVSCISVPHIYHPLSVMLLGKDGYLKNYINHANMPTRRQDKEEVFARNGAAIYITRRNQLENYIFGGRLLAYAMNLEQSIDIDVEEDFIMAESALQARIK